MESRVTTDYRSRGQFEGQTIHLLHPTLQQVTIRSSWRMVLYSSLKVYNTIRQVKIRDLNVNISPENSGPSIGQREGTRRAVQRVLFDHLFIGGSIFSTVPFTKPSESLRVDEGKGSFEFVKTECVYAPFCSYQSILLQNFWAAERCPGQAIEIQMKSKFKQFQILAGNFFSGWNWQLLKYNYNCDDDTSI